MPIRSFLEHDHSFGPEDIASLRGRLGYRSDPATMAVAKMIIEVAEEGERDPERLCAQALKQLSR
jgi:hypothetical protein